MQIGKNNKLVKLVKSLQLKKYRDKTNLFFFEGPHLIEEAIKHNYPIEFVMFSKKIQPEFISKISERSIPSYLIAENVMNYISSTENNQGIIAVAKQEKRSINDIAINNDSVFVICDGIQDPGNLGSIVRICAAVGVDGVFVSDDCVDIYNPKTIRATSGAFFMEPTIVCEDLVFVIEKLKNSGIKVYCSDSIGGQNLFSVWLKGGFAIVIGSEGKGVSTKIKNACQNTITIPINQNVESLNAAISCAVILFEHFRQRTQ